MSIPELTLADVNRLVELLGGDPETTRIEVRGDRVHNTESDADGFEVFREDGTTVVAFL